MGKLVTYRSGLVAPDVPEAVRKLEQAAAAIPGARLHFSAPRVDEVSWESVETAPGLTAMPPHLSMRPAGREVLLKLDLNDFEGSDSNKKCAELETLWGLAVPLGFMPWQRYPVVSSQQEVFHYLGPWASVIDSLHGEGRGEAAWPSACAAAQVEVGRWEGPRTENIRVQAQLHRLGIHCGPVDGHINERTLSCLRALGFGGKEMSQVVKSLARMRPPKIQGEGRRSGQIIMPGCEAFSSGMVHTTRTNAGYALTADGPGTVTLIVGA